MTEKSTGKDDDFIAEALCSITVISSTEGYVAIDPITATVVEQSTAPNLTDRLKKNGFDEIVKTQGVPGAVRYFKGLKEERFIPSYYLSYGQHPHIKGEDAAGEGFDFDLQEQDEN